MCMGVSRPHISPPTPEPTNPHTHPPTNHLNSFFLGKNKVMQKALGTHPEDEIRDNMRHLAKVRFG